MRNVSGKVEIQEPSCAAGDKLGLFVHSVKISGSPWSKYTYSYIYEYIV